jgi:hypothetical protein
LFDLFSFSHEKGVMEVLNFLTVAVLCGFRFFFDFSKAGYRFWISFWRWCKPELWLLFIESVVVKGTLVVLSAVIEVETPHHWVPFPLPNLLDLLLLTTQTVISRV